jgi:hypothetical protein
MLNDVSVYAETGRKCAEAQHNRDVGLVRFHSEWVERAIRLEIGEDKSIARKAYTAAYREASSEYDHGPINM